MIFRTILSAVLAAVFAVAAQAEDMKMSVTTSFANSGLADVLLPEIKKDTGINVQLLIVGTGQALKLGAQGDVDAVLVHAKAAELAWLAEGNGTHRREIMYNDFILVGPSGDPAGVGKADTATGALSAIAAAKAPFVSRGDNSGTHKMELRLWKGGRDRARGRLVPRCRSGHGRGAEHRLGHERLYHVGSRQLAEIRQQGRSETGP